MLIIGQNIKEGIDGKPVDWYKDVFELVFPNADESAVNALWRKELAKCPRKMLIGMRVKWSCSIRSAFHRLGALEVGASDFAWCCGAWNELWSGLLALEGMAEHQRDL